MNGGLTFYRLWCGKKRYTHWLADRQLVWQAAIDHGLAFKSKGLVHLGPLTWIEKGTRRYARSRTVPCPR